MNGSEELVKQITELADKYQSLVGKDHHKDSDCHWNINQTWSYGLPPVWVTTHYGYVYRPIDKPFETYEDALASLRDELQNAIDDYQTCGGLM